MSNDDPEPYPQCGQLDCKFPKEHMTKADEIPTPRIDANEFTAFVTDSTMRTTELKVVHSTIGRSMERENTRLSEQVERLKKQCDFYTERSVGAMQIAEGDDDESHAIPVDCPMLDAVSKLRTDYLSALAESARLRAENETQYEKHMESLRNQRIQLGGMHDETLEELKRVRKDCGDYMKALEEKVSELQSTIVKLEGELEVTIRQRDENIYETQELLPKYYALKDSIAAQTLETEKLTKERDELNSRVASCILENAKVNQAEARQRRRCKS